MNAQLIADRVCWQYDLPPALVVTVPQNGEWAGLYDPQTHTISLTQGDSEQADTLAHELAHHAAWVLAGDTSHGEYWNLLYQYIARMMPAERGSKLAWVWAAISGTAALGLTYAGIAWLGGQVDGFNSGILGAIGLALQAF